MAPFFSNWIVLLLTSLLLQNFSVHALPNPESSSFGRSSSGAAAAVPRVLFPRGRNAIEGLLASTDLVKRDSDDESPARKGDAGEHSTTQHKTDKEQHHVDGKVPAADKEHHVGENQQKTDKEHHVDGKVSASDKEHHVGEKVPAADQQKTDKKHHVDEKVAASDQQEAVAGGGHPQTHITAAEAARGGKVIKSGTDSAGPAKPAGKVLGKGKGGQKSGAKGTGKSKAGQESDDGKQTGVSLVGL